jgi:oxygen-independent coproporphyrinogen-3 oxidase
MHRTHQADQVGRAVAVARDQGLANVSLDLIFALPESLGRDWGRDLDLALALAPDHISLYGLTVEAGTPLFRQIARGEAGAPPDTRYEAEYLLAHERLAAGGLGFYEVSNASLPGREAVHNRAYWRRVPYLGLGPSAHSFDGTSRWWNEPAYARWVTILKKGARPVAGREILADAQRDLEQRYLGLRTVEGIELEPAEAARLNDKLKAWAARGWLTLSPLPSGRLAVLPSVHGWLRLDELVASI